MLHTPLMSTATNKATETTPAQWKALASAVVRCVGWQVANGKPVMGDDEADEISARIRAGKATADDLLVLAAMAPIMWQSADQVGGATLRARAFASLGIVCDVSSAPEAATAAIVNVDAILNGAY